MSDPVFLIGCRVFAVVKLTIYSSYICCMATASIDDCFRLLKYRANKAGYLGTISPNDFNLVWPRAERRYFNEQYKAYLVNQGKSESLMPFKTNPIPVVVNSVGQYTKPTDILHIDAIRSPSTFALQKKVGRVEDDRLAENLASPYDAPTADFPIYTEYNTYLQFNPINVGTANVVYLQKLADSVWGYNLEGPSGSLRPVYSPSLSVQPKWNDVDIDQIIYMVGDDIGINMRDRDLMNSNEKNI